MEAGARANRGRIGGLRVIPRVRPIFVMPGFLPDIHVFPLLTVRNKTWTAGTSSAKTRGACHRAALCADPLALLSGHDVGGGRSVKAIVIVLAVAAASPAAAPPFPGDFLVVRRTHPALIQDTRYPG